MDNSDLDNSLTGIAIIGMTGRFPGAKNIDEFWQNLRDGVEAVSFFSDEELIDAGIDPELLKNPNYVRAAAVLDDIDRFDADFFDFTPREAEVTDPQHRLFLECAWEVLEQVGYSPEMDSSRIGLFAGVSHSSYLFNNLSLNWGQAGDGYEKLIANDKDFLTTRVSYKLNLTGPSISVQTACSTSLVAVQLACQSLLTYQCDLTLAGGATVHVPTKTGYLYQEGGILSPDGHCRAFDADARGTIGGSGVGVVVLKRLEEAIADGDQIYAVIKGSAINNDGSIKVGYTAPSVEGQTEVIAEALALADIDPATLTYVEAHGTGTSLGDPIEMAALTQAFRVSTAKTEFCAIGSVKTNVGHLDAAAGVTGLIKTALALKHQQIPPSLNLVSPNPQIDFANSPFYVNTTLADWETNGVPRRAGVSSFGIGGTNAHVVLEEAPQLLANTSTSRPWQILGLAAKTSAALETATANLASHLQQHPELNLADVAYTLHVGRRAFNHRRMVLCQDLEGAQQALTSLNPQQVLTQFQEPRHRPIVFMFPGQGSQYEQMGWELYQQESCFKDQVDRCCELIEPILGIDLRQILYPAGSEKAPLSSPKTLNSPAQSSTLEAGNSTAKINQTAYAQPALFVTEYALAQLWMSWGIRPQAMIGHSLGEYVAACLAGVFTLEEALTLVAVRGQLMQEQATGAMLLVALPEAKVKPFLTDDLALAANNGPALCAVSGPSDAIENLRTQLSEQGIECRQLHTSHAFHSPMMEPMLATFKARLEQVDLQPPQIPFIANVTGTWITDAEATDPNYWANHLRQTVRFTEGSAELTGDPNRILLEVGPGKTLGSLARQNQAQGTLVLSSLRHPKEEKSDVAVLLQTLGRLWLAGVEVDWPEFYVQEQRRRVPLPTYPFDRQRYWVDPTGNGHGRPDNLLAASVASSHPDHSVTKQPDIADWFYLPTWKRSQSTELLAGVALDQPQCWLLFMDAIGVGCQLATQLEQRGQTVITVKPGEQFQSFTDTIYELNPESPEDYQSLLQALKMSDHLPHHVIHLGSVTSAVPDDLTIDQFTASQKEGFYSLLFLIQAMDRQRLTAPMQVTVVTTHLQAVIGNERLTPEKAPLLGLCRIIPQEYFHITCRHIDGYLDAASNEAISQAGKSEARFTQQLLTELQLQSDDLSVAYRGPHRWVPTFDSVQLPQTTPDAIRLRPEGVYLINGNLVDGIGLMLAEYLAQKVQAQLVLIGKTGLPQRSEWEPWLQEHGSETAISRRILDLQALEAAGAAFLIMEADVTDAVAMSAAIAQAYATYNTIHGIIHTSELSNEDSTLLLADLHRAACEAQFQSKVHSLLILEQALASYRATNASWPPPDFYLSQSSMSSIVGGLGLAAYAGANLFIDALAQQRHQSNVRDLPVWTSVNWDALRLATDGSDSGVFSATLAELAMTPDEMTAVFDRLFAIHQLPSQIVVSTGHLAARLTQWTQPRSSSSAAGQHTRPHLQTAYVAPRNQTEQAVAEVWQELLGIDAIGIYDDFFELGGHSMVAVQAISRLRDMFEIELPLRSLLFEAPNIAGLASFIEKQQPTNGELEVMAELLAQVEGLDPEEVNKQLTLEAQRTV